MDILSQTCDPDVVGLFGIHKINYSLVTRKLFHWSTRIRSLTANNCVTCIIVFEQRYQYNGTCVPHMRRTNKHLCASALTNFR